MFVSDKIRRAVVGALSAYTMIQEGDRVLVAVSGGVDSAALLAVLTDIQRKAPFPFELQPALVNHHFPDTDPSEYEQWINRLGYSLQILNCDTYSLVKDHHTTGASPCQLCSRLRRGTLYTYAREKGFSIIALGHNRDDFNETILLNMLYSGKIAGMSPKYLADDGVNVVIRPLCFIPKSSILDQSKRLAAPVIVNRFCETIPDNSRYRIRELLQELERENPKVGQNLLASQHNVRPNLLMDRDLWDFSLP